MRVSYLAGAVALFCGLSVRCADAVPLARFDQASEVRCKAQDVCALSVKSVGAVGSYTGVSASRTQPSAALIRTLSGKQAGRLEVTSEGRGLLTVQLSWDGDPNPQLLSGSGLGCRDLRADQGVAVTIKDLSITAECDVDEDGRSDEECPDMTIETRLYDASDPTGQMYSWSSVRRKLSDKTARDLVIPFSNFLYHAPRGAGRFSCAGALTVSFKVVGSRKTRIEMGPAFIDDIYGLDRAPTPTAGPTVTPNNVTPANVTDSVSTTPVPSETVDAGGTGTVVAQPPTPHISPVPVSSGTPEAPDVTTQLPPPTRVPDEGAVYGSVITP